MVNIINCIKRPFYQILWVSWTVLIFLEIQHFNINSEVWARTKIIRFNSFTALLFEAWNLLLDMVQIYEIWTSALYTSFPCGEMSTRRFGSFLVPTFVLHCWATFWYCHTVTIWFQTAFESRSQLWKPFLCFSSSPYFCFCSFSYPVPFPLSPGLINCSLIDY